VLPHPGPNSGPCSRALYMNWTLHVRSSSIKLYRTTYLPCILDWGSGYSQRKSVEYAYVRMRVLDALCACAIDLAKLPINKHADFMYSVLNNRARQNECSTREKICKGLTHKQLDTIVSDYHKFDCFCRLEAACSFPPSHRK
jgi:hypothetical protein